MTVRRRLLAAMLFAPVLGLLAGGTSLAAGRVTPYSPYWYVSATPNVPDAFTGLSSVSSDATNDAWSVGYVNSLKRQRTFGVIQHWNGQSWRMVPPATVAGSRGVGLEAVAALAPDDVWAVGGILRATSSGPFIEHWDGAAWSEVSNPGPDGGQLRAIAALNRHDIWAAGNTYVSGALQSLFEHWNGTKWKVVAGPAGLDSVIVSSLAVIGHDDVWAAGGMHQGYNVRTMTAHWDGTEWTVVPTPDTVYASNFSGVAGAAPNDVWAVGTTDQRKYGRPAALIEHWDGTAWTVTPSPKVGSTQVLRGVAAFASDDVWTVGTTSAPSGNNLTEHWDGTTWAAFNAPEVESAFNSLTSVAFDPSGNVWAVGQWVVFDPEHVNTLALHNLTP
jgi:hypothetical protein